MKIAITGFGRIGRQIFRQAFEKGIQITCINDPYLSIEQIRILLSYDSVYGKFPYNITTKGKNLIIDKKIKIKCCFERDLSKLNIDNPDFFIDCSGKIKHKKHYSKLYSKNPGLKKIIFTTHSKETDQEIICGVNDESINHNAKLISTSTCDAIAILPIIKQVLSKEVESLSIISLHPYLSNQRLLDGASINLKDISLIAEWRAALDCLIPKKTSIGEICTIIFPELKEKVDSYQIRVPTSCVSCAFIDIRFAKTITKKWTNSLINKLKSNYLINSDQLISRDFMNERRAGVIDLRRFIVEQKAIKMMVWYDNESGYSSQVLFILDLFSKEGR